MSVFCMCDSLHHGCTYAGEVSGVLNCIEYSYACVILCMMSQNQHYFGGATIECRIK